MRVNDRHVIWNQCQIFYTKLPRSHRKKVTDALVCVVVCVSVLGVGNWSLIGMSITVGL